MSPAYFKGWKSVDSSTSARLQSCMSVDNNNGVDQRKGSHGSSAVAESNPQVPEKPSSLDESAPVYQVVDVYPTSTGSSVDSQLPQHLDSAISDSLLPLSGLEYPRKSSLAPNYVQTSLGPEQQQRQVGGLDHRGGGYYQPYSKPAKTESSSTLYEPIVTTALPNVQRSHTQDLAPVYHNLHHENGERDSSRPIHREHGTQPLRFLPDPVDKPEEYYSPTIITETPTEVSHLLMDR
ncbi:hypothetical protein QAD02_014227 [Eretmocerus hayati]|uniref:Uncharacterized protein n=1 Tax=Eretmocerus hayati TaxID=131215 RepID=A0ACC2P4X2_9HYME|nr:hypothetical protein QAD02_014227 [Eretmocerus hayati]